jgi:hypothetical protein
MESITLVKKYVDARVKDVNNRAELIRDAWKEIYSLARNIPTASQGYLTNTHDPDAEA